MGGFGGAIEKSPAAATPLAFIRSTQFVITGTSLPTIAKSKLTGRWLLPVATIRRDLRKAFNAGFGRIADMSFCCVEVPKIRN